MHDNAERLAGASSISLASTCPQQNNAASFPIYHRLATHQMDRRLLACMLVLAEKYQLFDLGVIIGSAARAGCILYR
eukprot:scaffold378863_cov18-Prasinocladus_malaysianus.AAC.1